MFNQLKLTNDSKTRARKTQMNAFGLTQKVTCPGCTQGKGGCCEIKPKRKTRSCYVDRITAGRPNVVAALKHNTEIVTRQDARDKALKAMFGKFLYDEQRAENTDINFRLHWAGDVFSLSYAEDLAAAMITFPEINFWVYSRAFEYLEPLLTVPNLQLYLSLDMVNYSKGLYYLDILKKKEHRCNLNYCYMGEAPMTATMIPCPTDAGRMKHDGACHRCRLCLDGQGPIWFRTR